MCQINSKLSNTSPLIGYRVYRVSPYLREKTSLFFGSKFTGINTTKIARSGPFHAYSTLEDVKKALKECNVDLYENFLGFKVPKIAVYKCSIHDGVCTGLWSYHGRDKDIENDIQTITGYACTILHKINLKEIL